MNWLLIIVAAVLLIFIIRGWKLGLLRVLYSLVAVIVLIGLVAYATPHISNFVKENTSVYENVQKKCAEGIQKRIETNMEESAQQGSGEIQETDIALPEQITSYIIGTGENALEQSGVYDVFADKAASLVISGIAFFLALILALIIVHVIGKMLDLANKIPVIKGINRTLGIFAGALQGFIIIWLAFMFVALISGTGVGKLCVECINQNSFLKYLYYHNVLLEIIPRIFR